MSVVQAPHIPPPPKIGKDVTIGANSVIKNRGRVGDHVTIGNNVILEGNVSIGDYTRIDHGVVIRGNVSIGRNNWIYPYCVIGMGPQHTEAGLRDSEKLGRIQIGDSNVIREFTTIHLPFANGGRTVMGSDCYIMTYSHIAHDCHVHDRVTMMNKSTLGGHCAVLERATIGFGNNIHQLCRVGQYSMLGMGNNITKDVPPFALINRNEFTKINRIGMERSGFEKDEIGRIESVYATGAWLEIGPSAAAADPHMDMIREFTNASKRGVYKPVF